MALPQTQPEFDVDAYMASGGRHFTPILCFPGEEVVAFEAWGGLR